MNTVLIALIVVNVLISYKGFNDISFLENMSFMWEAFAVVNKSG
jgi:hypothetical protein